MSWGRRVAVLRPESWSGEYRVRVRHTPPAAAAGSLRAPAERRLDHVDLLRGLVMVIMVLDHVRDYLSNAHFDPTDLSQTNAPQMNDVSKGGCVIAAEVTYSYLPMLGQVLKVALNLKHTNFFLPRYGSTAPIDLDTTALATDACTNQT